MPQPTEPKAVLKGVALFAAIFGAISIFKGGGVLFGADAARDAVGDFVPFVVWFNFIAGFFYIIAGAAIWRGWAADFRLSLLIAVATLAVVTAFGVHVSLGGAYENQTVGALAIRGLFWGAVTFLLARKMR